MLLPDMTSEQMIKVITDDKPDIQTFADRWMNDEGKRILRNRHTVFPCSLTKFMVAPTSHQRYLLNFRLARRNEAYEGMRRYYVRAILNTMYGTEAANILYHRESDTMHIVYFHAHLFQRYAERMGLKLQGEELIRYFTKRNPMMIEATKWRKQNDCMMLCFDGACFGELAEGDQNRINLKTFIATDTMQDDSYRARLNETFDGAVSEAYWEQYFHDPEMADFLMKTAKQRNRK